ncbi:3067_t:CDS:1 [Ambispora leptoticha]|uniref:3067_t:CDS:1 n=1 Tax=Ambispora leptoticha TaxID=144679 RepID=A0A9N9DNA7_9GLOM|nr:3067_t:CDS:1 [Ambispora leptoticha]
MFIRRKSSLRRLVLTALLITISLTIGSFLLAIFNHSWSGGGATNSLLLKSNQKTKSTDNDNDTEQLTSLPLCDRSLTFVLSDCCGFPFQMTALINAIIYAKDTGRAFFLDDSNWNYGRWSIFFMELSKPDCVRPDKGIANNDQLNKNYYYNSDDDQVAFAEFPDHPLKPKELDRMDLLFTEAPHQIMTRWSWHLLDEHVVKTYVKNNDNNSSDTIDEDRNKIIKKEYEKIFKEQESVLLKIWRPNRELQQLTHEQSHEIGIPHNHGGMRPENSYIAFQIHRPKTLDSYLSAADQYLNKVAEKMNKLKNNEKSNDEVTVFITSRKELSEVRRALSYKRPNWQFVTSFEDEPMYRFDAAQKPRLMSYRLDSRINFGMAFIADITLMSQADHLVCTFSTSLCRFLVLLKGWKASTVNPWEAGGTTPIDEDTSHGWFPTLFLVSKDGQLTNPHNVYWINKKASSYRNNKFDMLAN